LLALLKTSPKEGRMMLLARNMPYTPLSPCDGYRYVP
jgi:hypothetical protein